MFLPSLYPSLLLLLLFMQVSIAALPLKEDVLFSSDGSIRTPTESGYVTGFIDADGMPNCGTCGGGELERKKSGDNTEWPYTSDYPDDYTNQVLWLILIISLTIVALQYNRGKKM